jgi:hypothetical protein
VRSRYSHQARVAARVSHRLLMHTMPAVKRTTKPMLSIHLSPQVPPAVCGVGDYATVVGGRMEMLRFGLQCGYVAAGHRAGAADEGVPGRRSLAGERSGASLWRVIEDVAEGADRTTVVLHYSGYGYDAGGAPVWLAQAVEQRPAWVKRFVTFFHELYATGYPWQRAFWYSRRQRAVAERIACASDRVLTNRALSARWLETHAKLPVGSAENLPVCSNIGEPAKIVPWKERAAEAVLFGNATFKSAFLQGSGAQRVAKLCRRLSIERIVDIGSKCDATYAAFGEQGIELMHTGYLEAGAAAKRLANARMGLFSYYPGYFAKSGVLAALAAFGVPPVMIHVTGCSDGLVDQKHLSSLDDLLTISASDAADRLAASSLAIAQWYGGHSVDCHARLVFAACSTSLATSAAAPL